ncbi:MAG: polysaccharide deacetylase family protein [Bacteroidetes bacterium]|nr:polysaccharide deacetylase family protein [Bacteroidota bacterium]
MPVDASRPPDLLRMVTARWVKYDMPGENRELFLTFDDGPDPISTPYLLQLLKSFEAKATFFCTGHKVVSHPHLLREIITHGHVVGNHSFSHLDGWKTPTENYISDVESANQVIRSPLFRPPYGRFTPSQYWKLRKKYAFVLWSLMSMDFHPDWTVERCLQHLLKHTRQGSLIVFHDSEKHLPKLQAILPTYLHQCHHNDFLFKSFPNQL